jgi:hypothetical protein
MPVYTPSTFPIGVPAINTLFKVGNGASPEVYSVIANIGDITGPGLSSTVVDVTSHSTSNPWREKLITLLDSGDFSFPIFWVPASDGGPGPGGAGGWVAGVDPVGHSPQGGVEAIFTSRGFGGVPGAPYNFAVEYPDGLGTTDYFTGFISKLSKKAAVAGVLTAECQITTTGEPIFGG